MPVSAQEWAASASMDADAVSMAATDLAIAISRLAANAMITVTMLSPPESSLVWTGWASGTSTSTSSISDSEHTTAYGVILSGPRRRPDVAQSLTAS